MDEKEKIDDLVAMIDNLMQGGQGHVNVFCEADTGEMAYEATVSKDCGCTNSACAQPTEFIENEEEEK